MITTKLDHFGFKNEKFLNISMGGKNTIIKEVEL